MATKWTDEDTKVTHIRVYDAMTLCGIMQGWTHQGQKPVKIKWGITCKNCQLELENLKRFKQ